MPRTTAQPKLSILILTYNRQEMLAQCLDSVRATEVDCEIVVCDDASTDGTADLLAQYATQDPRIRHYRQPTNVGMLENFRTALGEARGRYISALADDDSVLPGNYEKKAAILDAHPAIDLVYSLGYITDESNQNREVTRCWQHLDYSYIGGRDEFSELICGDHIPTNSVMFRRTLLDERGGPADDVPPELTDWDLMLRYTCRSQTAFINEPLVNVLIHAKGISSQKSGEAPAGMIAVWRKWLVDREDPIILHSGAWDRMSGTLEHLTEHYYPNRPDKLEESKRAFEQLRQDAAAGASRHFARVSRGFLLPGLGQSPPSLPGLVWSGPVFALDDDGADLRACALAAERAGLRLRLENLYRDRALQLPPQESQTLFDETWAPLPKPYLQVCQSAPRYFDRPSDALAVVGRIAWATDRLPAERVERCNEMDAMWAPSRFHCDTFAESGVSPAKLRLVPGCVDSGRYGRGAAMGSLGTGRGFNFLAVLDWWLGAGWDVLVRAFAEEFRADEDAALMLLVRPPTSHQPEIVRGVRDLIVAQIGDRPSPVFNLQFEMLSENSMASLMRAAQAYVQPNRAASWGRPLLQAMASGLPTIATAWGNNLDVLSEHTGYPVECQLVDVPPGVLLDLPTASGHRWAEPSLDHLRVRLRQVFTDRQRAEARGQQAQAAVAAKYDATVVGATLRELVGELT